MNKYWVSKIPEPDKRSNSSFSVGASKKMRNEWNPFGWFDGTRKAKEGKKKSTYKMRKDIRLSHNTECCTRLTTQKVVNHICFVRCYISDVLATLQHTS